MYKEIIFDGGMPSCNKHINDGHSSCMTICCENSRSQLFPGEEKVLQDAQNRGEIPDDVVIFKTESEVLAKDVFLTEDSVKWKIKGCMGKNADGIKYCKLGDYKTLFCKLFPAVSIDIRTQEIILNKSLKSVCPAVHDIDKTENSEWKTSVDEVIKTLQKS